MCWHRPATLSAADRDMASPVLIIDSDDASRTWAARVLKAAGHPVAQAATAAQARAAQQSHECPVVVIDPNLSDADGLELLRHVLKTWPSTQALVLLTDPGLSAARRAIRSGAADLLPKALDKPELLLQAVRDVQAVATEQANKDALIRKLSAENEELERVNNIFRRLAIRDGLTALHNRLYFNESLTSGIDRARKKDHELVLIFIDIDHFKLYNDTFGHQHGDLLLKQLGKLIRSAIRESDVAARWGGEEFAILAPETTLTGGVGLAEKLRTCFEAFPFHGAGAMPGGAVTASAGVAALHPNDNERELVHRADRALYQAKASGRNRVIADESGCGDDTRKMLASLGRF
jgi:diguanylate cyclase (GGDEF)-like protein